MTPSRRPSWPESRVLRKRHELSDVIAGGASVETRTPDDVLTVALNEAELGYDDVTQENGAA